MLESSNYELNIKYLRAERVAARFEFEKITECITKTMTILNGKGDVSLVTIADFKLVPLNELVMLTSKVSFIKVIDNDNEMHFKTYLKAGGKYGIHTHDCDEYTTVVKGHLIELLNNNKTYVEGETVVYFANSLHEPACEVDSEYYVIFKTK
jgi:quercetin dioxygenase-like cupin family protein